MLPYPAMSVLTYVPLDRENRDKVETYLAFGASRFEACKPIAIEGLRLALLPTINQMSVIGTSFSLFEFAGRSCCSRSGTFHNVDFASYRGLNSPTCKQRLWDHFKHPFPRLV